ncbi:MAG: hypothetical protein QW598_03040 [Pyrobaculum sp.]
MVKVTAACSEYPGLLEPSHGFGLLIDDVLMFDACSESAMAAFIRRFNPSPLVGVVGLDNEHHVGGFKLMKIPVVYPPADLELRIRGRTYVVVKERGESLILTDGVVFSPCGLFTIAHHALSRRGVKARCFVGGLGGTAQSPYLLHRVAAELRLMGVRCVVALHTAPQLVKELERRFNVYKLGAGSTLEV